MWRIFKRKNQCPRSQPTEDDYLAFYRVVKYAAEQGGLPLDFNTEEFLVGDSYKDVPAHTKRLYLITSLYRCISMELAQKDLSRIANTD